VYKIWHKNLPAFLSNRMLGVGSFLATSCTLQVLMCTYTIQVCWLYVGDLSTLCWLGCWSWAAWLCRVSAATVHQWQAAHYGRLGERWHDTHTKISLQTLLASLLQICHKLQDHKCSC